MFANWKIALKRFIRLKQEKYNRHKEGKSSSPVSSLVPHATHAALGYAIIVFRDRQIGPHTVWLFQLTYFYFPVTPQLPTCSALHKLKISLGPTFHEAMYDCKSLVTLLTTFDLILQQDCSFNKQQSNSALRVSFQGTLRLYSHQKCSRWYFKFNGNECSGPMTIEAVVYSYWPSGRVPDLQYHRSFEGYCENIPQGAIRVELWVGQCSGYTLGDAYTGWKSVSRIMIEEVSRPQS